MSKRNIRLLSAVAALVVLGAGCGAKKNTVLPTNTTNTASTVTVPVNTSLQPTNSRTTGDFTTSGESTTNTALSSSEVGIMNMMFVPSALSVKKGTTVTWSNTDAVTHTITGDNGGPASSYVAPGSTYSYTFTSAGLFKYHCSIHPSLTGSVTVTE